MFVYQYFRLALLFEISRPNEYVSMEKYGFVPDDVHTNERNGEKESEWVSEWYKVNSVS